eukprot:SAG22_NODE_186_length_15907_cov_45.496774_9_plen_1375_part_00
MTSAMELQPALPPASAFDALRGSSSSSSGGSGGGGGGDNKSLAGSSSSSSWVSDKIADCIVARPVGVALSSIAMAVLCSAIAGVSEFKIDATLDAFLVAGGDVADDLRTWNLVKRESARAGDQWVYEAGRDAGVPGGRRLQDVDGRASPCDLRSKGFRTRTDACYCFSEQASCEGSSWGLCRWAAPGYCVYRDADHGRITRTNVTILVESLTPESVFSRPRLQAMQKLETEISQLAGFESLCEGFTVDGHGEWTGFAKNGSGSTGTGQCQWWNPVLHGICQGQRDTCFPQNTCPGLMHGCSSIDMAMAEEGVHRTTQLLETNKVGNLQLVADGFVDQWFSTCNLTSSATSFTVRMRYTHSTKQDFSAFLDMLADYLKDQPSSDAGLSVSFSNHEWEEDLLMNSLLTDAHYATGSIVSVFVLMLIQTRSVLVTILGFLHILLSLPVGFFFYRIILGQHFVGFLNGITVFIIMGIGADDVFVFFDGWRQSVVERPELRAPENAAERVRLVLGKSISAMSVTSFSTAAAFAATAVSPIPALRTFGIFCGMVVCANFLFVVTYFPAMVLLWSKKYEKHNEPGATHDYSGAELAFERYGQLLKSQRLRRVILLVFAFAIGTLAVLASHLPKPVAMPMLYRAKHNYAISEDAQQRLLQGGKYPIHVYIYYGVQVTPTADTERGALGLSPPDQDRGHVVWDDSADLTSVAAQEAIVNMCDALLSHQLLVRGDVECLLADVRGWREAQGLAFPIQPDELVSEIARYWRQCTEDCSALYQKVCVEHGVLRMLGVQFRSVLDSTSGGGDVIGIRAELEDWLATQTEGGPEAAVSSEGHIFQLVWTLYTISSSGVKSMLFSLALAFVVLMLFFGNRRVAVLAFFSICCTTVCAMGFIACAGWEFGILESICVTILVGVVVDYVVHMGIAFLEHEGDSATRTVQALKTMGVSVTAGWVTSVISAVFLVFCTITFFVKFGIFMVATLALSLVFSLAFFPALLIELGPGSASSSTSTSRAAKPSSYMLEHLNAGSSDHEHNETDGALTDSRVSSSGDSSGADQLSGGWIDTRRYWPIFVGVLVAGILSAILSCPDGAAFCAAVPPIHVEREIEFTMPDFPIPVQATADSDNATTYECYGFAFPDDALYHVTEMSPILDDELVHHMILYKSPNELGQTEQCFHECVEMPAASTLLYAFAVGMGPFILPPRVGFPVGKFSDTQFTTLQIHYNNPGLKTGHHDSSGVRIALTTELRRYNAGIMTVGRVPKAPADEGYGQFKIPAGVKYKGVRVGGIVEPVLGYEASIECSPRLIKPVKVFAKALHAHLTGRQIWAEQLRNGKHGTPTPTTINPARQFALRLLNGGPIFSWLVRRLALIRRDVFRLSCLLPA